MTNTEIPKVLRAERIELVDAAGNLRCRIGQRVWPTGEKSPRRFFAVEMFDPAGECLVRLAMDDDGAYKGLELGTWKDDKGHAALEARYHGEEEGVIVGFAGLALDANGSGWNTDVMTGTFPSVHDHGPSIDANGGYFRDRASLDRAVRNVQPRIDYYLKEAEKAKANGNPSERRSALRYVRQLQDGIEKARDGVERRHILWQIKWNEIRQARLEARKAS